MANGRREFLAWLGASALLSAGGSALGAQDTVASSDGQIPVRPVSDEWDMSWVDRIHGDARAVFDAPAAGRGGECVWRAARWLEDYATVYGVEASAITAVLVVRHEAIPMVMDNDYWSRFDVGKGLGIEDGDGGKLVKKWAVRNPVSSQGADGGGRGGSGGGDGGGGGGGEYTIEHFISGGGIVLACHMAFLGRVVQNYMKKEKLSGEEAYTQAKKHLLPGVILQPTGIFAVLRAQQAGCAYVMAS